jgi:hypothetical protein
MRAEMAHARGNGGAKRLCEIRMLQDEGTLQVSGTVKT